MIRTLKALGAAALLALSVLLAAGCGGGGEETSLTKAQFIEQADAICKEADEAQAAALKRLSQNLKKNPSIGEQEDVVAGAGLPPVQKMAEEIAALPAPDGDEERIEAIVAGLEEAVGEAEEDPAGLVLGTSEAFDGVDKLSAAYGFKACSEAL